MPIEIKDSPNSQVHDLPGEPEVTPSRSAPLGFSLEKWLSDSLALTRLARLSAAGFVLLTGSFFLLSSFTFSWLNIVRNENVLWVPKLVESYAYLYWAILLLNAATLLPAFRQRRSRWITEAVLILLTTIGLLMTRVYRLSDLPLSFANLAWSVVLTLPLAGLGLHDLTAFGGAASWTRPQARRTLSPLAGFACGGLLAAWYFAIAWLRYQSLAAHLLSFVPILLITACLQGCLFAALEAGFSLAARASRRIGPQTELICSLALIWIFASLQLRRLVTPAVSFNSAWADVWAGTYPLAFVVMLAGWHVRRAALRGEPVCSRAEELLSGLIPGGRGWTALACAAALLAAFLVPYSIEQVDWNFLFQRLSALAVWTTLLVVTWRVFSRPEPKRYSWGKNFAVLLAALGCCFGLAQSNRLWRRLGLKAISQVSAAYNGMDASFQVAQIVFRPAIHESDPTGLYPYLRRNALIADPIHPPALKLVESFTPTTGPKPDIYIVVVDTLRRDYLSPYNPHATFTPHIAAFATESFVFQHAYTNYGGTALSEPAIWAGMMLPSKQYVEPFSDMNALEQLTNGDGYRRAFTLDQILRRLLTPSSWDELLNAKGTHYFGLDLRDTVQEIEKLPASSAPQFVYTQPQNLHPLTLNRLASLGEKIQGSYPGFQPRYADELSKVDVAFGELVDYLKAQGRFDKSIVILTSDHGDWLGEYGRWGHGQSLLSPITEVPLLIHLPRSLAGTMYCDTGQEVFLTDITPSLYYLLGHRDLRRGEFYGRPLFTRTADEQKDYAQPYHLFMSSYAAVFAILEEKTKTYYVADAVDENQGIYNLNEDWYGLDNLIEPASQHRFEQLTRGYLGRLNALYGYSSDHIEETGAIH